MKNINDFFKKLSRKRSRSESTDTDIFTRDLYLDYIKQKINNLFDKPKTSRQLHSQINKWLDELNTIRNETAETDEELNKLTQKLHDVTISERILFELLNYIKKGKNKITKKEIVNYLDKIRLTSVNKLMKKIPEEDTLSDFIIQEDEYEDDDYEDNQIIPGFPAFLQISFKKNNFVEEWNKRFNEIREHSMKNMSEDQCHKYLNELSNEDREKILSEAERVEGIKKNEKPMYFKILDLPIPLDERKEILKVFNSIGGPGSDSTKSVNWIDKVMSIPFGKYIGIKKINNVKKFIKSLEYQMNQSVYGHDDAKRKIIQIMCQGIRNKNSKGLVIGLEGPPGNGKTTLIENGICKVLERPFIPISLGGAQDSSFLEGHSFTYIGSIPGRIAEGIISSKCMNPVFYFDELDKISNTDKGLEIVNLLVHLIDPAQNHHYRDKYFHGVNIDLSKATFIFSFNDASLINHILLDRITVIKTQPLDLTQKQIISNKYLLPNILKDVGLKENSIKVNDEIWSYIINKYTFEGGVRKFKELMYHIVRELNIYNLTKTKLNGRKVIFPIELNLDDILDLLKDYREIENCKIHKISSVGIINGMWASLYGVGGVLPIEIVTYPTNNIFTIKKTGSMKQVMQESIEVALAVAWNKTNDNIKKKWTTKWKDFMEGFHVHCPDGATPKDGPSAGSALTTCFYSLLNNKIVPNTVSLTGEINLRGEITRIGGLAQKIAGSKKAGVKKIYYPNENQIDIDTIREKTPEILKGLELIGVDNIDEVLTTIF